MQHVHACWAVKSTTDRVDAESSGQTSNVQGEKAKLIKVWNVIKAGVKG